MRPLLGRGDREPGAQLEQVLEVRAAALPLGQRNDDGLVVGVGPVIGCAHAVLRGTSALVPATCRGVARNFHSLVGKLARHPLGRRSRPQAAVCTGALTRMAWTAAALITSFLPEPDLVVPAAAYHLPSVLPALFVEKKPDAEAPWTRELWIYDFRTNQHFTMKTNPLRREHLDEFVAAYRPGDRPGRVESERFRRFGYDGLVARDKANLDITWLKDDSLEDPDNLPAPQVLIAEIQEEMAAILEQFGELASGLGVEPLADVEAAEQP